MDVTAGSQTVKECTWVSMANVVMITIEQGDQYKDNIQ